MILLLSDWGNTDHLVERFSGLSAMTWGNVIEKDSLFYV